MKRRAHLKKAAQQEHRLANQQTQGRRANNRRASRVRRSGAQRKHQQLRDQVHDDSSHSLAEIHERKGKQAALRPLKRKHKARQQTQGRRAKNRRASRARRSGAQRKHQQLLEQVHDSSHSLAEIHERKGKQAALRPLKRKHKARQQTQGCRAKNRRAKRERKEAAPSKKKQGFRKHSKHDSSHSESKDGSANRPQKGCSTRRPLYSTPANTRAQGEEPPRKQSAKKRRPAEKLTA